MPPSPSSCQFVFWLLLFLFLSFSRCLDHYGLLNSPTKRLVRIFLHRLNSFSHFFLLLLFSFFFLFTCFSSTYIVTYLACSLFFLFLLVSLPPRSSSFCSTTILPLPLVFMDRERSLYFLRTPLPSILSSSALYQLFFWSSTLALFRFLLSIPSCRVSPTNHLYRLLYFKVSFFLFSFFTLVSAVTDQPEITIEHFLFVFFFSTFRYLELSVSWPDSFLFIMETLVMSRCCVCVSSPHDDPAVRQLF